MASIFGKKKDSSRQKSASITKTEYQKNIEAQRQQYLNELEEQKVRDSEESKDKTERIRVVSSLLVPSDGKIHVAYTVAVYGKGEPQTMLKTYSQLEEFHKKVDETFPLNKKSLPKFPPRKRRVSTDFVEKRKKELDNYMDAVGKITGIFGSPMFQEFCSKITPTGAPITRKPLTEEELQRRRDSVFFEEQKKSSEKDEGIAMSTLNGDGVKRELDKQITMLQEMEIQIQKKEEQIKLEEKHDSLQAQRIEETERILLESNQQGSENQIRVEEPRNNLPMDEQKRRREEEEMRKEEEAERMWIETENRRKEQEEAHKKKKEQRKNC